MNHQPRGLFLDRDGILNEVVIRKSVISSPRVFSEFHLIDAATPLITWARQTGWKIFIVTNQPDLDRSLMPPEELARMHDALEKKFLPDAIEVCPSGDDLDRRRKPNPGMLLDLAKRFQLDLTRSVFIGDSGKDVEAGKAASVHTIFLRQPHNQKFWRQADKDCSNHAEILTYLQQHFPPTKQP